MTEKQFEALKAWVNVAHHDALARVDYWLNPCVEGQLAVIEARKMLGQAEAEAHGVLVEDKS